MCTPPVPSPLLDRASRWDELKRWERRELGQELRLLGLTYSEIGEIIPVPKGTLSGWCRDLELTEDAKQRLASKGRSLLARQELGARRRREALERAASIRDAAREEAQDLLRDPFWVAGVVAYWSEGDKRSKELKFSNSDPALVSLFVRWAKAYVGIGTDRLTIGMHLHSGQDESERKTFWSSVTEIPPEQFRKTFIKPEGTGHRKNRLYNGTASVRVRRSGDLSHRVMGWIDALSDQFPTLG